MEKCSLCLKFKDRFFEKGDLVSIKISKEKFDSHGLPNGYDEKYFEGKINFITQETITLDCSQEFKSKIEIIAFKDIISIEHFGIGCDCDDQN